MKLNVLLGKTDAQAPLFKGNLKDFIGFFQKSQSAFHGERNTYEVRPDMVEPPNKRSIKLVQTTVDEKLKWLEDNQSNYLDNLFSQEATNASGTVKAKLVCDDVDFGELSSLELLRLKNIIDMQEVSLMYSNLPVRSDTRIWNKSNASEFGYDKRDIYETETQRGIDRTTEKDPYILEDPNVVHLKDTSKYVPQQAVRTKTVEVGEWTRSEYSGETTQLYKAQILARIARLKVAIQTALKQANEVEQLPSQITGKRIFDFLHRGQ